MLKWEKMTEASFGMGKAHTNQEGFKADGNWEYVVLRTPKNTASKQQAIQALIEDQGLGVNPEKIPEMESIKSLHDIKGAVEKSGVEIETIDGLKVVPGYQNGYGRFQQMYDIKPYITDFTVLQEEKRNKICLFADHYHYYCTILRHD